MRPEIPTLGSGDIPSLKAGILAVYAAAFGQPPYSEKEEDISLFADSLDRHAQREGFRCVVARDGRGIVGFGYGYTSAPVQWWHDVVARAMGEGTRRRWLEDSFEVVDLAVLPDRQGQGIGGRLHDALLAQLPLRTALLSTLDAETPARALYRKRGWQDVLPDFVFPGVDRRYVIMGRDLQETRQPALSTYWQPLI